MFSRDKRTTFFTPFTLRTHHKSITQIFTIYLQSQITLQKNIEIYEYKYDTSGDLLRLNIMLM